MADAALRYLIEVDPTTGLANFKKWDKTVDESFSRVSKGSKKSSEDMEEHFGGALDRTSKKMLAWGGLAVAALGGIGIAHISGEISELDKKVREVTTLLGRSSIGEAFGKDVPDVRALTQEILAMSTTLGDAKDLTEGLYQAISASVPSQQSLAFVEQAAKLAKAGLADMLPTVDVLTTSLNAYGLATDEVTRVSDVLFKTVERGKTTLPLLAGAMGNVIPFAAQLKIPIEEVSAAIATLTRTGLSTDEAVTSLRATFASLIQNADQIKASLGIDVIKISGEKGLPGLLRELTKASGGSVQKLQELIPETRALKGVLSLVGTQAKGFASDLEVMKGAAGATELAFGKMKESVSASFGRLTRSFSAALHQIVGEGLTAVMPVIESMGKALGELVKSGALEHWAETGAKALALLVVPLKFLIDHIKILGPVVLAGFAISQITTFIGAIQAARVAYIAFSQAIVMQEALRRMALLSASAAQARGAMGALGVATGAFATATAGAAGGAATLGARLGGVAAFLTTGTSWKALFGVIGAGLTAMWGQVVALGVAMKAAFLANPILAVASAVGILATVLSETDAVQNLFGASQKDLGEFVAQTNSELETQTRRMDAYAAAVKFSGLSFQELTKIVKEYRREGEDAADFNTRMVILQRAAADGNNDAAKALESYRRELKDTGSSARDAADELEKAALAAEHLRDVTKGAKLSILSDLGLVTPEKREELLAAADGLREGIVEALTRAGTDKHLRDEFLAQILPKAEEMEKKLGLNQIGEAVRPFFAEVAKEGEVAKRSLASVRREGVETAKEWERIAKSMGLVTTTEFGKTSDDMIRAFDAVKKQTGGTGPIFEAAAREVLSYGDAAKASGISLGTFSRVMDEAETAIEAQIVDCYALREAQARMQEQMERTNATIAAQGANAARIQGLQGEIAYLFNPEATRVDEFSIKIAEFGKQLGALEGPMDLASARGQMVGEAVLQLVNDFVAFGGELDSLPPSVLALAQAEADLTGQTIKTGDVFQDQFNTALKDVLDTAHKSGPEFEAMRASLAANESALPGLINKFGRWSPEVKRAREEIRRLKRELQTSENMPFLDKLDQKLGMLESALSGMGGVAGRIGQGIAGARSAIGAFQDAGGGFTGVMEGFAAGGEQIGKAIGGKAGGVLAGAAKGAQIGMIAGPYGALVGAAVGGLVAALKGTPAWQKAQGEISKEFGFKISEAAANGIIAIKDEIGGLAGLRDAEAKLGVSKIRNTLGFDLILKDAVAQGKVTAESFATYADGAMKQAALIKAGGLVGEAAAKHFGETFGVMAQQAEALGQTGTKAFGDLVRTAKATGKEIAQVTQFLQSYLSDAAGAIQELTADMKNVGKDDFKDIEQYAMATFNALSTLPGGAVAAVAQLGGSIDALAKKQKELKLAGDHSLDGMMRWQSIVGGNKQLFTSLSAIQRVAHDLGVTQFIDKPTFDALQHSAVSLEARMEKAGLNRGEALTQEKGLLQEIINSHQRDGHAIDASTQALIDEAKAMGLVKEAGTDAAAAAREINNYLLTGMAKIFGEEGVIKQWIEEQGKAFQALGDQSSEAADQVKRSWMDAAREAAGASDTGSGGGSGGGSGAGTGEKPLKSYGSGGYVMEPRAQVEAKEYVFNQRDVERAGGRERLDEIRAGGGSGNGQIVINLTMPDGKKRIIKVMTDATKNGEYVVPAMALRDSEEG